MSGVGAAEKCAPERVNDQELQFFDLCSSLILMSEDEIFLNETHIFS